MKRRWSRFVLLCGASLTYGADDASTKPVVEGIPPLPDVRQLPAMGVLEEGTAPNLTPRLYRDEPLAPLLPPPTPDEKLIATTRGENWLTAGMDELKKAQSEREKQARERVQRSEGKDTRQTGFLPGLVPPLTKETGARPAAAKPTPAPNPYLSAALPPLPKRDLVATTPRPSAAPTAVPTPVPTRTMGADREEQQKYFRQLQRF